MPAINSGKILVTGANGYVAVWVVQTLLEQGFAVRGTVRSEGKAKHLRSLFQSFGNKFELVIVEDITKEGAFDEAVKDVDAIAHTASPFHYKTDDPDEVIVPAVRGTTGILASAYKNGSRVKRIVVTSSVAAIVVPGPEPRVYSEADWSDPSVVEVNEKGKNASNAAKYRASKTLAERSAWEFWSTHKSEVEWDLVCLNPPYVYGPVLHEVDRPENLNESTRDWYETVVKGLKDNESLAKMGGSWVDVRDIAQAHALALTRPEASGERVIVTAGPFKWQDFVSIAHRLYPQLPEGNNSYDPTQAVHLIRYLPDKQLSVLGIKFRTIEETTRDTLEDFKSRGWL